MPRKYTDEDLIREFPNATSIADLVRRLGLKQSGGGSFDIVKKNMIRLGLDPEEIKNQSGKGMTKKVSPKISDEDVFCNPTKYNSPSSVRRRALKIGLLENKCYICGQLPEWNGMPMVMILDHIDGNNKNNLPENLRIVCPNCDTQLPTFKGKNIKREFPKLPKQKQERVKKEYFCEMCGDKLKTKSKLCQKCQHVLARKVEWPNRNELKDLIRNHSFLSLSKMFGVSDRAVANWCKYYGLPQTKKEIRKITNEEWESI